MTRRIALLLVVAAAAIACGPPSAADLVRGVIQVRNNYDANLESWIVRPDGALYMDVLVVNNNESALTHLTVLVEQLDAAGVAALEAGGEIDDSSVLSRTRVALEVAALSAGLGQNIGVTVPGASPLVEGVRLFIEGNPGQDVWPEFRELDAVRPRI